MSKSINIGQPLFNNIEGHPFVLGPQGPYRTKEEARRALIAFYEGIDEIPNGQECIIAGVRFVWRDNDLYENLAVKVINENITDLNSYRTPGTYRFNAIRNNNFANLPINNNNPDASITGELVVYSSVEGTNTYRSIIGQVLFLSNAEGHETKIYTRSANKTSKDRGVTYEVTWGDWYVCQGMKEVGVVSSYDSFTDNGMYSGVYNNNDVIETFVVITINDYAVKNQLNVPKSVSQLKYALNALNNKSELSIRVGGGQTFTWSDWKPVFDEENITTQINNIQNQLNALTEGTTGNINEIINNAINNLIGGAPEAYDTLKEIVDYINQNKDEVTGEVTDIMTSLNELQNLKIIDLGSNIRPDQATNNIITYVRDNNIKYAVLFKYIDPDGSSSLGICISKIGNNGWFIYLIARKGIERLSFGSRGGREAWNEYGGILRHQQSAISDGQLETMSINGLKSLIIDNLNTNETLDNTRKILSILSANQGRILNEKINTKQKQLDYYTETSNKAVIQTDYVGMLSSNETENGTENTGVYVKKDVASLYYAERDEENNVVHEDGLYLEKEKENGGGCVLLRSYNNGGDTSNIHINPSKINIKSAKTVEITSPKINVNGTINIEATEGISMSSPSGKIDDVVKEITDKAPKVGYAPDLKVNFAEELVGRGEATEEVIGGIRPTGVRSIGDGNATIERIKGESVVWNQWVKNHDLTNGLTNWKAGNGATLTLNDDGSIRVTLSGRDEYNADIRKTVNPIAGHKYAYYVEVKGGVDAQSITIRLGGNVSMKHTIYTSKTNISGVMTAGSSDYVFRPCCLSDMKYGGQVGDYADVYSAVLYNLTLMFGAGNESATIEDFEARKPLGVTNEYNEGTIVSYDGDALKSVGFNAYNGTYAKVIGGEEYHATGTTSISFAKELGGATTAITLDSGNKFIPEEDGYVYAEGTNIVIHLTHSYTPDHVDEYEEDIHPLPDVKSILDANGNQLFPYGLLSAGGVHDEITATKAVKRIGVVDMGILGWSWFESQNCFQATLYASTVGVKPATNNILLPKYNRIANNSMVANSNDGVYCLNNTIVLFVRDTSYTTATDFKQAMSGVLLYYELAEPIEVDLPEPLNMTYEAWDFGTEELIHDGATTPLNAKIVYQFNAVDRIRENSTKNTDLEARIVALEEMIAQLTNTTNNEQM